MNATSIDTQAQKQARKIADVAWDHRDVSDLFDRVQNAWACGNIGEDEQEAIGEAGDRDLSDEMDATLAAFVASILAAFRELIPGVDIRSDREGCASTYHELNLPGREPVQVRISNHDQRHNGPAWSFQPTDDAATHARGLLAMIKAVQEADDEA